MDQFPHDPLTGHPVHDQQRNSARDSLFLAAELRIAGEAPVHVRVRNLSAGGLMAEYGRPVSLGDPLDINLRGIGWVKGRVAWAMDARIGVAFDKPIDPLMARKPVGQPARSRPAKL